MGSDSFEVITDTWAGSVEATLEAYLESIADQIVEAGGLEGFWDDDPDSANLVETVQSIVGEGSAT